MQKRIVIYTKDWLSVLLAKRLPGSKGYAFEVTDATNDYGLRAWLAQQTGQETVPQVFIEGRPVGGYDDISALAPANSTA